MPERDGRAEQPSPVGGFALLGNFVPLCLLVTLVIASSILAEPVPARIGVFAFLLYLVPPMLARLIILSFGRPQGRDVTQDSRTFRVWWMLLQLQMPFNRLLWLEELLRLVPGLYPLWLNLWGAHVHPASFWAPGARMLDRSYLDIGRDTVIGSDVLISGHLARTERGHFLVDIAPVSVGSRAVIGARASIGPGCVIGPDETLTATSRLAPYDHFVDGKRQ